MTKVVEGTDVDFGDNDATADSVEAVVQTGSSISTGMSQDDKELMEFLADQVIATFSVYGTKVSQGSIDEIDIDFSKFSSYMPYIVTLGNLHQEAWFDCFEGKKSSKGITCTISAKNIPSQILRDFLEQEYGAHLAASGIYERVGLDIEKNVDFPAVLQYFPELQPLSQLHECFIKMYENPFQPILTLPVEHRAFFTGALRETGVNGVNLIHAEKIPKPLGLKQILDYAAKTNRVTQVADYIDLYRGI